MRLSVIMSVCNPIWEQLLEAVDSVLNQSFTGFEFLIYDDGSKPETARLLAELEARDRRIRCIRGEKNRGLAYGLNRCVREAAGEYLARMDDDDLSLPRRFARQIAFLDAHRGYGFVGCGARIAGDGEILGVRHMPERPGRRDFLKFSPYIHPSVMFRREVFLKYGGYDPSPAFLRCEDYEFFLRLHQAGCHGYNLQEVLFQYREDARSLRKRKFCFRRKEARLRWERFGMMGISGFRRFFYTLRPLAAGVCPPGVYGRFKRLSLARSRRKETHEAV